MEWQTRHFRKDASPAATSCASAADVDRPNSIAAIQNSLVVIIFALVFVRHLPKPAQDMLAIVFSFDEIAGAAERNGAGMTKEFPLPQRGLYSKRRICADDGLGRSKITVDEIKSYCDELSDFGH
jgi:hypothetical protein